MVKWNLPDLLIYVFDISIIYLGLTIRSSGKNDKDIYPSQLNVEKTNQSNNLASYLDLTFTVEKMGKFLPSYMTNVMTLINDFHIVNFPSLTSNIPFGPSYSVHISQLIRYARCCSYYDDFRHCHKMLVERLCLRHIDMNLREIHSKRFMADIKISLSKVSLGRS